MASYANPFTDRAGRRHKNNGQFASTRRAGPKRKRKRAASGTRRRDKFGRYLNPSGTRRRAPARRAPVRRAPARRAYANPFTDRAGRRHKNNGQFASTGHAAPARSRKRRAAATGRKRDSRGRFLNPPRGTAYANPFTDRAGRRHRDNGKFMSGRGRARGHSSLADRPRDSRGRLLKTTTRRASPRASAYANPFTDRAGRRHKNNGQFAATGRKAPARGHARRRGSSLADRPRDSRGRLLPMTTRRAAHANPFDGNGYWHDDAGRFDELPNRRYAKKRSEFARGVASHRGRRNNGTFKNPSSARRSAANRPRDARGHFLPEGHAAKRRPAKRRKTSTSRRKRDSHGRFLNPGSSHRALGAGANVGPFYGEAGVGMRRANANPWDMDGRYHERALPSGRAKPRKRRSASRRRAY